MDKTQQETGFTSISVSKQDHADYDEQRKAFAESHGLPENKVSMAMIIRVGMTYLKQKKSKDPYPEIKQAMGLLQDWIDVSANVTSNPKIAELAVKSKDYIENV